MGDVIQIVKPAALFKWHHQLRNPHNQMVTSNRLSRVDCVGRELDRLGLSQLIN